MLRPLIEIDEQRCNGCGQCVTDCAEGALAIIDGKAKLISESYCDGLGACLNCPQDALKLVMKEAPEFDEAAALAAMEKRKNKPKLLMPPGISKTGNSLAAELPSWPIQLELLPARASFLENANLLLAAHCSAFALPNFHTDWLQDHIPVIACPKLENNEKLTEKLAAIIKNNNPKSLVILRMSVPCCGGLQKIAAQAIERAGSFLVPRIEIVKLGN